MSRVYVKGLSKNITEQELRDVFSQKGEVTDVRIMRTKANTSRGFGFIGFRTANEAQTAMSYFNNTYLQTCKISVELASKYSGEKSDANDQSSKSKKSTTPTTNNIAKSNDKSVKDKSDPSKSTNDVTNAKKTKNEKDFTQFMEVMKSRKQSKMWSNDDGPVSMNQQTTDSIHNNKGDDSDDDESDSDDSVMNSEYPVVDKTEEDDDESISPDHFEEKPVKKLSDLDFLKSKMTSKFSDEDDSESVTKKSHTTKSDKHHEQPVDQVTTIPTPSPLDEVKDMDDTGRLFVRNLPFAASEDDLRELFASYGPITEIHIPLDGDKKGKGFAFIQFLFPEHSIVAMKDLDGSSFQGRLLHVIQAESPREINPDEKQDTHNGRHLSSYQKKKEEERKKNVNKKDGWNSSYVRSDAVVESLAERYGLKASEIINTNENAGDMAVNLAIGETQVIRENRDYLSSHGVNIQVLESDHSTMKSSSRSTTTLLIKNLPYDLVTEELENMFSRHGMISSFLVPTSKTMAVIDYIEPADARMAFKALAYRSYHKQPLYIEWAANDLLNRDVAAKSHHADKKTSSIPVSSIIPSSSPSSDDNLHDYSTLFIKNLNFQTTEESFYQYLLKLSIQGIRTISIQMKPKTTISMGFGFIEFTTSQHAEDAMKRLDRLICDGHALEVKPSTKRITTAPITSKSSSNMNRSTKLVVKNVPFQATQHELRTLFATYGSIKSVRIPKKLAGVHRGFAFIEFSTHQEALKAINALSGTHLYGRHLVLDWSKEDDADLDVLRKRAQHQEKVIHNSSKRMKLDDYDGIDSGYGDKKGSIAISSEKRNSNHDDDMDDDEDEQQ